ncbi:MAG: efflux RND transporter periplasmic adaptor subunit [bacterium]|nr:efflux RND transporter periplasmic adaptor subunit [bacterium]
MKTEMIKIKIVFVIFSILSVSCGTRYSVEDHHRDDDFKNNITSVISLSQEIRQKAGIVTEPVYLRKLLRKYSFPGGIFMDETKVVHVSSKVSGIVVKSNFKVGDFVRKGEVLALIDSMEVGDLQNEYLKAKAELEIAQSSYERANLLFDQKVISKAEFLRRYGEYLSKKSNLESLRNKLRLFGFSEKEISFVEKERKISSQIRIVSPISGRIIEAHSVVGEIVEQSRPIFKIADLSNLWVVANIPEKDISKIREGQYINFTVSAYPDKAFRGRISYVSDIVDFDTRTVSVRAEVQNPDRLLKPGMFANIEVIVEEINVLAVPKSAVQRDGDEIFVFVKIGENTFEKRKIEIGYEGDDFYQVLSGLREGEIVVVSGSFILKSAMKRHLIKGEVE